jgi:hypothetical protein
VAQSQQETIVDDMAQDGVDCVTAAGSSVALPDYVDIVQVRGDPPLDPRNWVWVYPEGVDLQALLSEGGVPIFGGLEILDPGGEIPPIDPTWFFKSYCCLGFDFGVNPEAGQVVTYRMMVQGGEWTPLPGAVPATIEGNRITLQVPRAEIAAEAIRFRMTATDSFVCDVVEFPVPGLP